MNMKGRDSLGLTHVKPQTSFDQILYLKKERKRGKREEKIIQKFRRLLLSLLEKFDRVGSQSLMLFLSTYNFDFLRRELSALILRLLLRDLIRNVCCVCENL